MTTIRGIIRQKIRQKIRIPNANIVQLLYGSQKSSLNSEGNSAKKLTENSHFSFYAIVITNFLPISAEFLIPMQRTMHFLQFSCRISCRNLRRIVKKIVTCGGTFTQYPQYTLESNLQVINHSEKIAAPAGCLHQLCLAGKQDTT